MSVEDFAGAVSACERAGYPCVQLYELVGGKSSCFIDTRPANGHMLELLGESEGLRRLYALVAELGATHGRDEVVEAGTVMQLLS
jgi:hypothetical protein